MLVALALTASFAAAGSDYPLSCKAAAKEPYLNAWESMFNGHVDEPRALLKDALKADGQCVLAKALLGLLDLGGDGKKLLDDAQASAAKLTPSEKAHLDSVVERANGDLEKAFASLEKERDLVPNVALVHVELAQFAGGLHKYDAMLAEAKKATELDPKSGAAWNALGYAYVNAKKPDDAVKAFQKYAEVAPKEPNAHDSLGDALLKVNKLDDAAAAYQKALDVSGNKFWVSESGVATVKELKGDYDGARAALQKEHDAASDIGDKLNASIWSALSFVAQGKSADALKAADTMRAEATAAKSNVGIVDADESVGYAQLFAGKNAEAAAAFEKALKDDTTGVPEGVKRFHRALDAEGLVEADARAGKVADAEKAMSEVEGAAKALAGDRGSEDLVRMGKAEIALAKKDAKGAVEALKGISEDSARAQALLAEAEEKAGDAKAAKQTRAALVAQPLRDPAYLVVVARLPK